MQEPQHPRVRSATGFSAAQQASKNIEYVMIRSQHSVRGRGVLLSKLLLVAEG